MRWLVLLLLFAGCATPCGTVGLAVAPIEIPRSVVICTQQALYCPPAPTVTLGHDWDWGTLSPPYAFRECALDCRGQPLGRQVTPYNMPTHPFPPPECVQQGVALHCLGRPLDQGVRP